MVRPRSFALGGGGVEPVENLEHFGLVLRRDADAVVLDRIDAAAVFNPAGHFNQAGLAGAAIFDGVVDQIGKDLVDLDGVAAAGGQGSDVEGGAGLLELKFDGLRDGWPASRSYPGV